MKQRKTGTVAVCKTLISIFAGILISLASHAGGGLKTTAGHTGTGLQFVENKGQWEQQVRFMAQLNAGAVFLTDAGLMYDYYDQQRFNKIAELWHKGQPVDQQQLNHHAFRVRFLNARQDIHYTPSSKYSFYQNYFIGSDSSRWAGKVGVYGQVNRSNVYDGIDLSLYSTGPDLKYDFILKPGADPSLIQLSYEGVRPVLTADGHLRIRTSVNEFQELAPFTYQMIGGKQKQVASRYRIKDTIVSFEILDDYDKSSPLIIDPQLKYATYSGATAGAFLSMGTTYDAAGSLYAAANATFPVGAWPVTIGAYQTTVTGGTGLQCGALNKYSPDGSSLIYSTYIGAQGSLRMFTNAMATTAQNELVITGSVSGAGYPVTPGAFDQTLDGNTDIFVTRFSADGSAIVQSTFVGGSNTEAGIASELTNPTNVIYAAQANPVGGSWLNAVDIQIDHSGNIWIASNSASANFPVTANAFQPTFRGGASDGVIFCLNPTLSALVYSSYYGGAGLDILEGITVMPNGNIAVSGFTTSNNSLTTTAGAYRQTFSGGTSDGYAGIVNPATGALVASTYLGTTGQDNATKVQANLNNEIYILGRTNGNYPVSAGTYNIANGMLFIHKLNSTLTASLASTRTGFPVGGINGCNPSAFLVDSCGTVYLSCIGVLTSAASTFPIMPVTPDALISTPRNFWCATMDGSLSGLKYASYFGAAATAANMDHQHQGANHFDPKGILYQSICARVDNNLGTPGSWSPNMQNSTGNAPNDPFSFKIDFQFFVRPVYLLTPLPMEDAIPAVPRWR